MTLEQVENQGFDASELRAGRIIIGCSECQALCINGTPIHEEGCSNDMHECDTIGCDNLVSAKVKICEDCANIEFESDFWLFARN